MHDLNEDEKECTGIPQKGVRVRWDNGEGNMYRYGAENCYDVVESN